jgi:chemosensory pili system protein ChpA (sensor histidine kinase/response regulator)
MENRILVIDDDETFLQEVTDTLRSVGYSVDSVSNPLSALRFAQEIAPDVIVLDLNMKRMSGFEIAASLKRDVYTARIPIIAVSGYYTVKEHDFLASFCGIRRFFKKPFHPDELISEVANASRKGRRNRNEGSVKNG